MEYWVGYQVWTDFMFAAAMTLFYRKSFGIMYLSPFLFLLLNGIVLEMMYGVQSYYISKLLVLVGLVTVIDLQRCNLLPYAPLIFNLFALLDGRFRVLEHFLSLSYIPRILICGVPQFLRHPIALRKRLQYIRSRLGPWYIHTILIYASRRGPDLKHVAFCLAFCAGVLFRPDNGTALGLMGVEKNAVERRRIHGLCMVASFVLVMVDAGIERWFQNE